jgi:hypothetical protein
MFRVIFPLSPLSRPQTSCFDAQPQNYRADYSDTQIRYRDRVGLGESAEPHRTVKAFK